MKLSAEHFEQIVSTIRADAQAELRGREQRRCPRVGVGMTVRVLASTITNKFEHTEMRVRDLSADGVGLMHHQPLTIGSLLCLVMDRSTGGVLKAVYTIVRSRQVNDSQFVYGCRLKRIVDEVSGEAA